MIAETPHLILREFTRDDAPFLLELVNSPGWLRFIGDRNIKTLEAAGDYATNNLMVAYRRHGFGLYHVALKPENISIGMCGLVRREALENVDIGFAFLPPYQGQGYAFEASGAVIEHARKKCHLKKLVAVTMADNDRSVALLNRLGFNFEKTVNFPGEDKTLMLYGRDLT